MLDISISVEGSTGLDWPRWQRLIAEIEQLGFSGIFLSDHFNTSGRADANSLDLMVALTYAADHTQRVHLGSMVAPIVLRDPVCLARQATAIDDLSGGRMILGIGAGWNEAELAMFGYELGDITTRMDRLGEGLAVISSLLCNQEPCTYEGHFFRLHDAKLAGPRRVGGLPILVGGSGPKRTLPLVARYADIWNAQLITPEEFRQRSALLDELLIDVGRRPEEVKRTMTLPLFCGRTAVDLERRAHWLRSFRPDWSDVPLETIFASLRPMFKSMITGQPAEVIQRIIEYAEAGVSELVIQWGELDDVDGLRPLVEEVVIPLQNKEHFNRLP